MHSLTCAGCVLVIVAASLGGGRGGNGARFIESTHNCIRLGECMEARFGTPTLGLSWSCSSFIFK